MADVYFSKTSFRGEYFTDKVLYSAEVQEALTGNIGFASTLVEGINISFCSLFICSSGLKIHCSAFVVIFGFGFAIVLTFGKSSLNASAAANPGRYQQRRIPEPLSNW